MTDPTGPGLCSTKPAPPSRRSTPRGTVVGWLAFPFRTIGPLALALLLPTTARAEVCDKERPFWDRATGPATSVDEALHFAASPLTLILLVATALAIRFRSSWAGLAVVCGWSGFVGLITFGNNSDPTGIHQIALQEGCIGSPALFIAVVAAISVATIIYTSPRAARGD